MNEQLQKLIGMLQSGVNKGGDFVGNNVNKLGSLIGSLGKSNSPTSWENLEYPDWFADNSFDVFKKGVNPFNSKITINDLNPYSTETALGFATDAIEENKSLKQFADNLLTNKNPLKELSKLRNVDDMLTPSIIKDPTDFIKKVSNGIKIDADDSTAYFGKKALEEGMYNLNLSDKYKGENIFNKGSTPIFSELDKADDVIGNLSGKLGKVGNFISKNPGQALGGAALGGLNLAGLADGEDILLQLLAGAGGAGLGYAKGGVPGAVMGGLGGGAAGDMLPKLLRMLEGQ
jgi:hypothetical protein